MPRITLLIFSLLISSSLFAQKKGIVRGFVKDIQTNEGISYAHLKVVGTTTGASANGEGFYSLALDTNATITLRFGALGYDSLDVQVDFKPGGVVYKEIYLEQSQVEVDEVVLNVKAEQRKVNVAISQVRINKEELELLPNAGGVPDLTQAILTMPGVVSTGAQGGQVYILGGTPVMNKFMVDGLMLYQPFHTLSNYSILDASHIQSATVYSAGFGAENAGRISSVIDVRTRQNMPEKITGEVNAGMFVSSVFTSLPLIKKNEGRQGVFLNLSARRAYYNQTGHRVPHIAKNELPFEFGDYYAKLGLQGKGGSRLSVFGLYSDDRTVLPGLAEVDWTNKGVGSEFFLAPKGSSLVVNGNVGFSRYDINMSETNFLDRRGSVNGFNGGLNFSYVLGDNELKYGVEFSGFTTDLEYYSPARLKITQNQNTSELGLYLRYRWNKNNWVVEPGLRTHYYASLRYLSKEPRLAVKYNASDRIRLKGAWGIFAQNFVAAYSQHDVVQLFQAYVSAPDEMPWDEWSNWNGSELQNAMHYVAGIEWDPFNNWEFEAEAFAKDFKQLISFNRYKVLEDNSVNFTQPYYLRKDFIPETGLAYGGNAKVKYSGRKFSFQANYTYTINDREDHTGVYRPVYDRRHSVNLLTTCYFDDDKTLGATIWWNYGSGFPFTRIQAGYEKVDFTSIDQDYATQNGNLQLVFEDVNKGELPSYHSLDINVFKEWKIKDSFSLKVNASVKNAYNRENIFYMNHISKERVNQLPVLPAFSINGKF